MSGRRARGAGAGTLPRGAEPGRRRAGLGRARGGGTIGRASRPLSEPPAPGRGMEGAGVALEVRRCVDPPAARPCSSCCSSPPPRRRLRSRRRPPRCLLAGRAAGVRARMVPPLRWPLGLSDGPPPSSPKATSLRSSDLYIPGWVLPNATRSPRRGEGARGEPGGGRDPSAGAERRAPPAPTRELVASSCFPGSAECAPRSRRVPKALSPRPGSAAVWRLCQRFHDKTRRKKNANKIASVLPPTPAGVCGGKWQRASWARERKGVWWSAIISDPWAGWSRSCS